MGMSARTTNDTVVVDAQAPAGAPPQMIEVESLKQKLPMTGPCECDAGTFCCALLCPCVVTGRVAEYVGRDNCTMCCASCLKGGSGCFHACTVGHELRYQNGMEIHLCRNACYTGLCSPCGLAQDYYFVK